MIHKLKEIRTLSEDISGKWGLVSFLLSVTSNLKKIYIVYYNFLSLDNVLKDSIVDTLEPFIYSST